MLILIIPQIFQSYILFFFFKFYIAAVEEICIVKDVPFVEEDFGTDLYRLLRSDRPLSKPEVKGDLS